MNNSEDLRRGKAPQIRAEENVIEYSLAIGVPKGVSCQLILRCERDGEIYVSIQRTVVNDRS